MAKKTLFHRGPHRGGATSHVKRDNHLGSQPKRRLRRAGQHGSNADWNGPLDPAPGDEHGVHCDAESCRQQNCRCECQVTEASPNEQYELEFQASSPANEDAESGGVANGEQAEDEMVDYDPPTWDEHWWGPAPWEPFPGESES